MLIEHDGECVFKWAQQGYDGKGSWISQSASSSSPSNEAQAVAFCRSAIDRRLPLFVERKISFRRELALVACRSRRGEFAAYPLVVTEQKQGICHRVRGPAIAFGVSDTLERQARSFAQKVADSIPLEGVFAVEMFETDRGELLVNELAPRVHNSGHFTQDASRVSQFENHLRAVLGLSLGQTDSEPAFAMLNLLGPQGLPASGRETRPPLPFVGPRLHLHWYGKTVARPGRKMGHLNAVARQPGELPSLLLEMTDLEERWRKGIEGEK